MTDDDEDGATDSITDVPESLCEIRLDGPYGIPMIHDAYRKILLVVDGAGYTAALGYFEYMLDLAVRGETQISVDLVWIAYDPHMFLPFQDCLRKYSKHYNNDPDRLFDVRLFYYMALSRDKVTAISTRCELVLEKGFDKHGNNKLRLLDELDYLHKLGSFTLIMAFGSEHLLTQCKRIAFRVGAHYRCDPFTL